MEDVHVWIVPDAAAGVRNVYDSVSLPPFKVDVFNVSTFTRRLAPPPDAVTHINKWFEDAYGDITYSMTSEGRRYIVHAPAPIIRRDLIMLARVVKMRIEALKQ